METRITVPIAKLVTRSGRVEVHADHPDPSVKGRHFPGEVILLCVCQYLRYPLACEHVAELLAERGVEVDPQLHLALGAGLRP
jgi:hypothetical protein